MRWTEHAPTAPGFCWQRGDGDTPGPPRVVEVAAGKRGGDPDAPDFDLRAHVSPIQWDNVTPYGASDVRLDLVESRPTR